MGVDGVVVGLPAYFYPWPGGSAWWRLKELEREALVVANPASGPGDVVDPCYEAALEDMVPPGTEVLGYVDDDYGTRPPELVLDDMRRWVELYGVSGVFIDQTRSDSLALKRLAAICDQAHAAGLTIALNPGQPEIDPRFLSVADYVVMFEGDLATYVSTQFREWVQDQDPAKIWHLVYAVAGEDGLATVARLAATRNVGMLFATDRAGSDPWGGLPSYWPRQPNLDQKG